MHGSSSQHAILFFATMAIWLLWLWIFVSAPPPPRWIWMDFENVAENENKPEIGITYGQGTWHRFSLLSLQNETTADFDSQMVIVYNIISWWRIEVKENIICRITNILTFFFFFRVSFHLTFVHKSELWSTSSFDTNENSYSSAMRPWSCLILIIK